MKPKIHECLANDELRPTMCHALITSEDIVASDAHVLVWHKTKDFFDEDFIKSIPKEGILVPKPALYDLSLRSAENFGSRYFESKDKKVRMIIIRHEDDEERYFKVRLNNGEAMQKYPAWQKVWPTLKETEPVTSIGINPVFLAKLAKAIGSNQLHIRFHGANKAMVVFEHRGDYENAKGLIMPAMFNT